MLQITQDTLFNNQRVRVDALAFCPLTGANFIEARREDRYALIIQLENMEIIRYWPRAEVTSEQALAQAQCELDANTAPAGTIQLQKQPPGTVQKINNAIRRTEIVYWEDENHLYHKIILSRRHQGQFQVKLALDQRWHNADIKNVFCAKQPSRRSSASKTLPQQHQSR
jgi:hypothetical protein